jgi:excisionase family DNA binding protein
LRDEATMSDPNEPITIAQATEELGMTDSGVRRLCRSGALPARKLGPRMWLILRKDVAVAKSRPGRGNPAFRTAENPTKKAHRAKARRKKADRATDR